MAKSIIRNITIKIRLHNHKLDYQMNKIQYQIQKQIHEIVQDISLRLGILYAVDNTKNKLSARGGEV